MVVSHFAIFFLTIDRCLAIKFKSITIYSVKRTRKICCNFSILTMVIVYLTNTLIFTFELPLRFDKSKRFKKNFFNVFNI